MILAAANWLGLHIADWIVLVCYFIVVLAIGLWSMKQVKNMSDFFMGGRRFGKIFMMFFAFGSGTSSEQAVTVVAGTWRAGLVGIWWQLLWIFATPFYWIVAPVMRRMRALTTADFFESRYDTSTATLYSVYGIVISIVFLAALLFASGKMVNALTGGELDRVARQIDLQVPSVSWDTDAKSLVRGSRQVQGYEYAVLAMTVMFVTYGMAGGLGAAILTDFIQGILTITFSFLLLPFVFHLIGGFGSLHEQAGVKEGMLDLVASAETAARLGKEPLTVFYVFMLSLTALAGIIVQPHIMGVCAAGKTEFEGRFGFTVGNFLKRFCTMAWTFTGLACIVWYLSDNSPLKHLDEPSTLSAEFQTLDGDQQERIKQDRKTYSALKTRVSPDFEKLDEAEQKRIDKIDKDFADRLFGKAAYDILPTIAPGLVGLLLASLLAAMMSSGDAQMVVSSGLFTDNIYRRFMVKDASQRHYLWVGRISGLLIVIVALALQSTFYDVIDAIKVVLKTPAAIGISMWFGIVWRRWTAVAVWVSTICSATMWWFVAYRADLLFDWTGGNLQFMYANPDKMLDAWQMVCYIGTGVVSGVVVSLITPRTPQAKLDHFFTLIHTPVRPGEQEGEKPCTLPADHLPKDEKLFNLDDIELPKPTWLGLGGFVLAWILVGFIIWLTSYLAKVW
jgi:Na+/proline symporter